MYRIDHLMNYVETDTKGLRYYVSTNDTFDHGLETMVFAEFDGETDWMDIHSERHDSVEIAVKRHQYIINHIGELTNQ